MRQQGRLGLTPCDPIALSNEYGTPLLVLSLPRLNGQLDALSDAWRIWPGKPPQFYVPLKTNDFRPFIRLAVEHGFGIDATEADEIDLGIREFGLEPSRVVVSGPAKSDHLLYRAVLCGARLHIDNLDELQAVHSIARRLNCRANVGFRLRFGKESKFGFSLDDEELTRSIDLLSNSRDLSLVAIHHHEADTLNTTQGIEATLGAIQRFRDRIPKCAGAGDLEVDLGGGLNFTSERTEFRDYKEFVHSFRSAACTLSAQDWAFGFEWGRALFGPCGSVIARVVRRKHSQGRQWLFLDAGQNIIGGGHAGLENHSIQFAERPTTEVPTSLLVSLAGPLCFRSDIIAKDIRKSDGLLGEIVVIGDAGAYTLNTRWQGPGKRPVVLLETEAGVQHIGRLPLEVGAHDDGPHTLDRLFRTYFRDEFGVAAAHRSPETAYGISSGTNNLDCPQSLQSLLRLDVATGDVVKAYTGSYGSDEIVVAGLAFEEALAGGARFSRDRCVVTLGAAQGCAIALRYLQDLGYDHCIIVGPQYPLIHDVLRRLRFGVTELLGTFEAGHIPTDNIVVEALRVTPRSVVFLTIPNNPTGTCPTEVWLRNVFEAVGETRGHVLIDRSSEDLPCQPWVRFSRSTLLASEVLRDSAFTVVNSCSKSRSVPGLRLGYLLGSVRMTAAVAEFNYLNYLSLPRIGTRLMAADLVLRALWWRRAQLGESPRAAICSIKETVCRTDGPSIDEGDLLSFTKLLSAYTSECESRLACIRNAQGEFARGLSERWLGCTPHHNGFNVVAEIQTVRRGAAFAEELFRATALRLLPTECFTRNASPLPSLYGGLTFRLSTADEPLRLHQAAQALGHYIGADGA
jgi:diaminopimelate decarboxylase